LIYRLLHFKDAVVNVDVGLKRRNRELVKPIIQLFSNAEPHIQKEIASTLEVFLKAKQTRKENTIEAALCPIVTNLVSEHGKEIPAKDVWNVIVQGDVISGYYDERRPNEFQSADYGPIYRNTITNIICDKFGAQKKHKEIGSVLVFDIDKLAKIAKSYDLDTHIQLKLTEDNNGADGSDSSDDFSKAMMTSKENNSTEITDNSRSSVNISEGNPNNIVNNTELKNESLIVTYIQPSEPSDPSVNVLGGSSTANLQQALQVPESIYRIGHSDNWACRNCRLKRDKWFMRQHLLQKFKVEPMEEQRFANKLQQNQKKTSQR
jgi:hypothetical protein